MAIKIKFINKYGNTDLSNRVILVGEDVDEKNLKTFFSNDEIKFIKSFHERIDKKNDTISFNLNQNHKITLIKISKVINNHDLEKLSVNFFEFVKRENLKNLIILTNNIENRKLEKFLHAFKLRSYDFQIYKSKKNNDILINVFAKINSIGKKYSALEQGINFARDLVSEPPNVLYPKEYVSRLLKLKKLGVKVTVYNELKLKKLGMNSLLGVGRGSAKESYLVTMEWFGNKKNKSSPLSFVGKGVCFDTGGISLKPAKFMEEMKYDMAGSAVVAGLIQSLAMRKSKVNAVGVVGLVENMPGGNAQRPGDIVKAYNGKTIEVLNTDAEGRLVLADALSFTEKKFKPKFIIDLATLTGAIIVALGEEYAGLFSNNDDLSKKLFEAGEKVNEKVWRLPLHKNYDKLMDSTIADIQNINYSGGAGSITAAQFLQRFIEKTPWAHLDIAGMAFSKKAANLNPIGATGFGVRLLNQLIEDHYE